MTARKEALALLRERFPEPWRIVLTDELAWIARATFDGKYDGVRIQGWSAAGPLEAARACIAAWDEATKDERALADRLAEALEDYYNGLPSHGAQSAIAAWRAARGKA